MRKVKCENMHFFDADMTTCCPHCGAQEAKEIKSSTVTNVETVEKKKGLFSIIGKKSKIEDLGVNGFEEKLESDYVKTEKIPTHMVNEDDYALSNAVNGMFDNVDATVTKTPMVNSSSMDERQNSMKTVSLFADEDGEEPTTGWLVCVKGKHYGRSFEIKTGQNCIGRDFSMDICLKKEDSVSRDKHAYIIFEPKKCMFLLRSGGGKGLTYCNDELVLDAAVLKAYDKVQLGEAEFLFVPFCGEQFMWSAE